MALCLRDIPEELQQPDLPLLHRPSRTPPPGPDSDLSVPKNRNRRKIAAFSNRKVLNRRLCRRNRRKNAAEIAKEIAEKSLAIFWAAE